MAFDRYILPETVMAGRFNVNPRPRWETAVLCCRDLSGSRTLLAALSAKPIGYKVLWGMDEFDNCPLSHQIEVNSHLVGVIARCQWGGPQTAILVEELAHLGVKRIIGVGAVGSLTADLGRGTQVVATSCITSDGTSRAYTSEAEVFADPELLRLAAKCIGSNGHSILPARAAAVDAIYRETHVQAESWSKARCQMVNMEIAALYAASKVCGLKAVWIGHVSDCLINRDWQEWESLEAMTIESAAVAIDLLKAMHATPGEVL